MEGNFSDKYTFLGEWYDSEACLARRFNVSYYPTDDAVEMYDIKHHRKFMRRMKVDGIKLESFFIGCTLNIMGRLVKILDFACENTRVKLQKQLQVTFVLIKPIPTDIVGKIVTHFLHNGLRVTGFRKVFLSPEDIHIVYKDMLTDPTFVFLQEYLKGKPVYGLELNGRNAVEQCIKVVGAQDPLKAEPGTIRALYGQDAVKNCVDCAQTTESAIANLNFFFYAPPKNSVKLTPTLSNCTLCIVKPHAIQEKKLGDIIEAIAQGGFEITALYMLVVDIVNSAEFFEVYKGIVPEYKGMIDELSSGSCVAMEIVALDRTKHSAIEFRKLVGPADPEIARLLRPNSIRGRYGVSKVKNAVHCSDLPEDGLLEVEYFFKILNL